jgi:hypothetical protein
MKSSFALTAALLAAACSKTSGDAPGAAPSTTSPPPAIPAAASTTSAGSASAPPSQACAQLAVKCLKCPDGGIQHACAMAVGAGARDARVCVHALADRDLNAQCN